MSQTILVVDADRPLRELVQFCLEAKGYKVQLAESAAQALVAVDQAKPDLVITEVKLNGANGLELCQNLQAQGVKVMFLSALAKPAEQEAGLAAGASRYLCKPFLGAQLVAAVEELL